MQQTENLAPHVQEIARALSNKLDPEAIEDELRRYLDYGVPLVQAKRDIVRMHGGSLQVGERQIATLLPEDKGFELHVKVLSVQEKEITVKGAPKTIWKGLLGDASGVAPYTAWKDLKLEKGRTYRIRNAYAKKGFREGVELNLGDYVVVEPSTASIDVPNSARAEPAGDVSGGASRVATERLVRDIRDGQTNIALKARILEANEKTISTVNGQKTLVEGVLADATGRIPFSAWEPEKLPAGFKAGAVIELRGGYARAYRGVPNVNFGQYATVEVRPSDELPDAAALQQEKPFHLGELESAGGGEGILVEGVVLEVKKGSGIIFRCAHAEDGRTCNRVLQKMECRLHGKQKGTPDLRIKAVLDDGHGAATFFVGRDATERILGKSLAQAQEMARDAMTVDVVQDLLVEKLTARRVLVRGRATSDEFGLTILANDVEYAPAKDATAEAEKLLGALDDAMREVA